MIRGIDHIDLQVNDLARSVEIFKTLGFEVIAQNDHHGGTYELKLPGSNQPIFDVHPVTPEHLDGQTGVVHIAFRVDNAEQQFAEMQQKGIVFAEGTHMHNVELTGRTLFSIHEPSVDATAVGTCYLQFVDPNRRAGTA